MTSCRTVAHRRQRRVCAFVAWITCLGSACPGLLLAELPSIRLDRIYPMGLGAGSSVEVEFQGRDTEEVQALRFDHPGLRAEFVAPGKFKVHADAALPMGTYELRLVGKFGVSNPRLLSVTRGVQEINEVEPNNDSPTAQALQVDSIVNGSSDGNGQDIFRVRLAAAQRVVIDCQAMRLNSPLDANLILSSASGQTLAASADYYGRDPLIDFTAPQAAEYNITIHDLTFRGGLPYRLLVTSKPQVETVFPRAVEAGKTTTLTAFGRNLRGDSQTSGQPFDQFTFPLTVPSDLKSERSFSFLEHPDDHSVAPTAATFMLHGYQVRVPLGEAGAFRAANVLVQDGPVTAEQEYNDDRAMPQPIALPACVSGAFDQPRDEDWYRFETGENDAGEYVFEAYSERICGQADPYLALYNQQGTLMGEYDDYGPRVNAFDGHIRDPIGTFTLQPKTRYWLVIQDRYGRGGPRYQYVLTIRKPTPDFDIALIHSENPGPAGTTVRQGGTAFVDVIVNRHHGYSGPIEVTAEKLPAGLHVFPTIIASTQHAPFVIWSDETAPVGEHAVQLVGTASVNGQTIKRVVRPYTRIWSDNNPGSSQPMREFVVGVREKAPYALAFEQDRVSVEAGKEVEVKLIATRLWPECTNKINAIPLSLPGFIQVPATEIAAGATQTTVRIQVQNGTKPGDYTVTVLGQSQVPYNKDSQAKDRPETLVSAPARPITITVVNPPEKQ